MPTAAQRAATRWPGGRDAWTETALTYAGAPAVARRGRQFGGLCRKNLDASRRHRVSVVGNGTVNLALLGANETATVLSSREGSNAPVLVVTTGDQ